MEYNSFNTNIIELQKLIENTDLSPAKQRELFTDIIDYVENVPFISSIVDKNIPKAKDLPRDEDGKIIIDLTKPHQLEDMDYFRQTLLFFQKNGVYTKLYPNRAKNSSYRNFWKTEKDRIINGMVRESDGEWIPGQLYFYWNYVPIKLVNVIKGRKAERVMGHPHSFLGDYLWYHYKNKARGLGKHCEILKSRGCGFEQPNSEIVATPYGFRKIGDIKVNDYLIDRLGNPTKVLELYPQGNKDVYEVSLHDGRKVKCGGDHLWKVIIRRSLDKDTFKILTTKQLLESGLLNYYTRHNAWKYRIPNHEAINYDNKELPIPPYTLGLLLGDGSMSTKSIKIATSDPQILDDLIIDLNNDYYIEKDDKSDPINNNWLILYKYQHSKLEENKKYKNYQYGVNPLKREIIKLGLNVSTEFKFIPNIYKYSSIEQRMELLRGLMDSDGSINTNGDCEFSNSNLILIKDVEELCRSLGINCTFGLGRPPRKKLIRKTICNIRQEYRLYIHTNKSIFKLKRKLDRVNPNKNNFNGIPIIDIKKLDYKEESTCFLVDNEEHIYLTRDYIPTHNSFKNGADGARNAVLVKNSNTFYFASKNEYIDPDKDGVLLKTWDSLDYLAIHTPFPKLRIKNTLNEKTIGYLDKRTGTIKGNKSLVMGASTKDDPDKPRGKRGDIIFEEYGSYPNIRDTWNACRDSVESGGFAFAQMTAGGTSSIKDSNFHGAEEMFNYPKPYNILGISNVYEKNSIGEQEVGFFWGAYMNREQCYDKDGNPDIIKALFEICLERIEIKYSASDPSTLSTRKAEKPITPKEACLQTTGSIFPVGELVDYLTNINLNRDKFISNNKVGDLIIDDNNVVKFKENSNLIPIRSYNKEGANRKGAIEIFNLPIDINNKDRYILGADPVDADYIKDGSLASIFVFDMLKDDIVAEYTGRPKLAEEYYELCYKLALFYNGKINYENNLKGMFSYFDKINKTSILMDTPSILKDIEVIKSTGIGNRSKGTPANKQVNAYGRKLLADWMMKERIITENNEPKTILNLFSIKSIGLLEEASKWNEDGNFDRISAMGMTMIAREEYLKNINFKSSIKQNRKVFESKFLKKFGSHR